ncbi:hypothetical protein A3B40_00500 [Candidatus Roizmanbacteria bacterium RIFCSPLOWO2_01_FULL_37_16]|uniref:Glycosidase n=1 Tax=Candidatus Roizmanbacteria bacterium RIFCSPLOWO2_01_FULL_37_16 TaxID=1802058 RepID=A0A1F7IPB2_9BACT|nr:MAG: hypothetical protein A2859_05885 [Candidatus Roizmanbacteria bacterium RIFCSPHIGHO2_01_FULL_37_16b]OGK45189.1 MAG: hypothetical protein A3B40_00500 [Candidatus Roizmanbacteria bacterium RIFCSPLOWO2_01_FULL_37_16]
MELINKITLRLKKFINNKVDRSVAEPIKIVEENGKYFLILKKSPPSDSYISARSLDGFDFDLTDQPYKPENFIDKYSHSAVVADFVLKNKKIVYYGDRQLQLARSSKTNSWSSAKKSLLISPHPVEVGGAFLFPKGIIVLYYEKIKENGVTNYKAFIAEFDKKHPDRLIWKTDKPIWETISHWPSKKITSLGSVMIKNKIVMYWYVDQEVIYGVYLSGFFFDPRQIHKAPVSLNKHSLNPIITPRPENDWEAFTTLNPAATYLENKVHILYRAQGYDYISTVGYAVSSDGVTIDMRLDYPIYGPSEKFEMNKTGRVNPELMSAGGWGGCEDPRITLLEGRLHMVYVAFDGRSNLRLALTSIDVNDFLKKRWNWEKPLLISPPHVIDKSGCLLPEKINGKYVFFHRVFPDILIDFVEDLNFKDENKWLKGEYKIKIRPDKWDSRKIGAGAPPLRTKDGWLLIYYGVNDKDASKYQIGAMLLDLYDPTKVLYRSNEPILSPNKDYEINGFKPGIAYPCGAVIIKDNLFVYYGAADSVVCVAQAKLEKFLSQLKTDKPAHLSPIEIKEVTY